MYDETQLLYTHAHPKDTIQSELFKIVQEYNIPGHIHQYMKFESDHVHMVNLDQLIVILEFHKILALFVHIV